MTRMIAFFIAILVAVVSADKLLARVKELTDSRTVVTLFNGRNKRYCHAELFEKTQLFGYFVNCTQQGSNADCHFSGLQPSTPYDGEVACCDYGNARCDEGTIALTTKGFLSIIPWVRGDNRLTVRGANRDPNAKCVAKITHPWIRTRPFCRGAECAFVGLKPNTVYTIAISCCTYSEDCVYGTIKAATTGNLRAAVTGAYGDLVNIKVSGLDAVEQCTAAVIAPTSMKYKSFACTNLGNMADCVLSSLPVKTAMDFHVECCSCGKCKSKVVKATTGEILKMRLVPVHETDINLWAYHADANKKCEASILFPPNTGHEKVTCRRNQEISVCKFKNLEKQVEYTFGVKCCHGDECNSGSASGSLEGSNDKRPYVKEVTAEVVSTTSVKVNWKFSGRSKLCYATAKPAGNHRSKACKARTETGTCTIHGLKKLEQYTIYVECCVAYSVCAFGEDEPKIRMDMQKD